MANEEGLNFCKELFMAVQANFSRKTLNSWTVLAELFPLQTVPVHMVYFFGIMYKNAAL